MRWAPAGLAIGLLACGAGAKREPPPAAAPAEDARSLFERGQLDAALAKLPADAGDADTLSLLGAIWAKKAELAPLPTPPPPPSPAPPRATPAPAPEFKPEELTALEFFEKALAAQPGHPRASYGLAALLAPHAGRQYDLAQGAQKAWPRHAKAPQPSPALAAGPDFGAERVVEAYRAAVQGDPTGKQPAERLLEFASRVGRLEDADWALQELVKRDREKPEPLVRYGDFLLQQRKQPEAAIAQYRQALMWRPDDDATKAKIAEIYLGQGVEAYGKSQYAVAQSRLLEAKKWVADPNSPLGLKIRDYLGKLEAIRHAPR